MKHHDTHDFILDERLANDSAWVADLPLCQVRLMNHRYLPWLLLVPRVPTNMAMIHQLSTEQQNQLMQESTWVSQAIEQLYQPDKLNVGALGLVVKQLHWHVVGRFENDGIWPHPIWGNVVREAFAPCELTQHVEKLQHLLTTLSSQ